MSNAAGPCECSGSIAARRCVVPKLNANGVRDMAFTEGFISELVGRRATVNDLSIGKVSDFLVSKPEDAFPQIDGLVVKTSQGPRFAPMETVDDVDRDGNVALNAAPKELAPSDDESL